METVLYNIHSTQNTSVIGDDLLVGAAQIAAELGVTTRRAYFLCDAKEFPAFKLGGTWCARRSALIKYFEALEKGVTHPGAIPSPGTNS